MVGANGRRERGSPQARCGQAPPLGRSPSSSFLDAADREVARLPPWPIAYPQAVARVVKPHPTTSPPRQEHSPPPKCPASKPYLHYPHPPAPSPSPPAPPHPHADIHAPVNKLHTPPGGSVFCKGAYQLYAAHAGPAIRGNCGRYHPRAKKGTIQQLSQSRTSPIQTPNEATAKARCNTSCSGNGVWSLYVCSGP